LSLTELLVSSVLIGIVMVGVAAFSLATKQMRDSTSRATVLSIQTAAALNFIATDAMKAVGDNADRGVVTGSQATRRSICFRHDVNDPTSYADDTWQCYFNDSSRLYRCDEPTAGVPPAPTDFNNDCNQGNGAIFLAQLSQTDFAGIVNDAATGRFQYVSVSLNTIYDENAAADPIQNPTYALSTRISPPGHGR
jgi:hypothetical protein